MDAPTFSICIPAYKADSFLAETLESVRAQTFSDWELIVIENNSKDGTESIVNKFGTSVAQNVCYTRQDKSTGPSPTRNFGISITRAPWIALLDSDDIWLPEHLESCWKTALNSGAELIHSGSTLFDSSSGIDISRRAPSRDDIAKVPISILTSDYIIQPSSVILSRALWNRAGQFDPDFRVAEDLDLWLRCLRTGSSIAYTGRETCRYRKHASSSSMNSAFVAEEVARIFEKNLNWSALPQGFRRMACAQAWSESARLHWRSHPKIAAAQFKKAFSLNWKLKWYLQHMFCKSMAFFGMTLSN